MMKPELPPTPNQMAETQDDAAVRFSNSLLELRELRSQLHHAAEYCETTFLKAKDKRDVMESTKEYICRAVVTVVDHLGSSSDNLNSLVSETDAFSEAQFRINCLIQRLLSCEQCAHKLALTRMQWSDSLPKFHSRYLLPSNADYLRNSKNTVTLKTVDEEAVEKQNDVPQPLTISTCPPKISLGRNLSSRTTSLEGAAGSVMPVRDCLTVLNKGPNPTFHFQSTQKVASSRKSNDILSLIRRRRRGLSYQTHH